MSGLTGGWIIYINVYEESDDWQNPDIEMHRRVSTPAVLADVFFRVNVTVNVSGGPTHPQEMIERWVWVSHRCTSAPPTLGANKKANDFLLLKGGEAAGGERHHGCGEFHRQRENRQVG